MEREKGWLTSGAFAALCGTTKETLAGTCWGGPTTSLAIWRRTGSSVYPRGCLAPRDFSLTRSVAEDIVGGQGLALDGLVHQSDVGQLLHRLLHLGAPAEQPGQQAARVNGDAGTTPHPPGLCGWLL